MNQSQVSAGGDHIISSPHETVICTRAGTQLTCLWLDPQLPEHSLHMVGTRHMLPEWVPLSMPVWACVSQGCGSQSGTTMCVWGSVWSQWSQHQKWHSWISKPLDALPENRRGRGSLYVYLLQLVLNLGVHIITISLLDFQLPEGRLIVSFTPFHIWNM